MREDTIGRPMEILMIEDSLSSARITMGALKKSEVEHNITWIADGAEGVSFLVREGKYNQAPQPDLVLLDLNLPGRDGHEVLKDIRTDGRLEKTAVVILSASDDEEDHRQVEELGVQSYLTKPVDLDEFLRVVQDVKVYWKKNQIGPEQNP
ncbi:MAG: response regulator [Planctomycetaceae bacterium]